MQDYGAYIVDDTGSDSNNFSTLITNYNAWSQLDSDLCSGDRGLPFGQLYHVRLATG